MVGAKDLAFPKINLLSWYLYVAGACFLVFALLNGGVDTGWTFTTPRQHPLPQYPRDHRCDGSLHRRVQLHLYRPELYRDHPPHALPGHDLVPACRCSAGRITQPRS